MKSAQLREKEKRQYNFKFVQIKRWRLQRLLKGYRKT